MPKARVPAINDNPPAKSKSRRLIFIHLPLGKFGGFYPAFLLHNVIIRLGLGWLLDGGWDERLKVTTVGNSVGVILPKEILERLRVKSGDSLYAIETKNGIELIAYNPEFAKQVEIAERIMREDRDALRKLAK